LLFNRFTTQMQFLLQNGSFEDDFAPYFRTILPPQISHIHPDLLHFTTFLK